MVVLDYLLHSGSENVINYCEDNLYEIKTLREFQYIDEDGKDQGANVRQKAKDITNLLTDKKRLYEERRIRSQMRDRMLGSSRATAADGEEVQEDGAQRRRRPNGDDEELQRAIEESKRTAEQELATAEDRDLQRAIQMSNEEEEKRKRALDEANAAALFDESNQQYVYALCRRSSADFDLAQTSAGSPHAAAHRRNGPFAVRVRIHRHPTTVHRLPARLHLHPAPVHLLQPVPPAIPERSHASRVYAPTSRMGPATRTARSTAAAYARSLPDRVPASTTAARAANDVVRVEQPFHRTAIPAHLPRTQHIPPATRRLRLARLARILQPSRNVRRPPTLHARLALLPLSRTRRRIRAPTAREGTPPAVLDRDGAPAEARGRARARAAREPVRELYWRRGGYVWEYRPA